MNDIYKGNAKIDGEDSRGWIIGSFIPEGLRNQQKIEIKYGIHVSGEVRTEWVTGETRTAVSLLLNGRFRIDFREESVELSEPGDYIMWGPGTDHKWQAIEDCTILTVRWVE